MHEPHARWEQTSGESKSKSKSKSYASYGDEDCYALGGTLGSLAVPTMRVKRYAEGPERSWWQPCDSLTVAFDGGAPLEHQLAPFCDAIKGLTFPLASVHDGLQNLHVIGTITRAAQSGRQVLVEELPAGPEQHHHSGLPPAICHRPSAGVPAVRRRQRPTPVLTPYRRRSRPP